MTDHLRRPTGIYRYTQALDRSSAIHAFKSEFPPMEAAENQNADRDDAWPIIVLTLDGDDQRREPLMAALRGFGLPFELFFGVNAIDGLPRQWTDQVDQVAARANLGRDMTDGEFGCALSHLEIYRLIQDRNLPGAVVLEDDVIISERFSDFWRAGLYRKAGLTMLDHSHCWVRGQPDGLMPGIALRRLSLPSCRTTAYSISSIVARSLRDDGLPARTTADWPGDIVKLGAVALEPKIVSNPDQAGGRSLLQGDRGLIAHRNKGFIRSVTRRLNRVYWRRWLAKRLSTRIS